MIEPQVLQGGASSWFWIAAYGAAALGAGLGESPAVRLKPDTTEARSVGRSSVRFSSLLFTPAWNCASCDRNFVASQRKM